MCLGNTPSTCVCGLQIKLPVSLKYKDGGRAGTECSVETLKILQMPK
jgi:hypothetical protein